jgi:serine phosphatase RsbU (regulator of sigma subunit)/anti-sigma regulatory factor (Ser/Thr protein kinase)
MTDVAKAEGAGGSHADEAMLQSLQRVTDAALAHLSEEALLRELLLRIAEILATDTAAILLLDETTGYLHARAANGIEEEVERGVRIPVGKGFAGRIAGERRSITIDDVDHADILNPILREKGIRSLLGVPLLLEDRVLGVLHVGSLAHRHFTDRERDLLQLAADRAAIAIEHANLHEQRRLAEAMQRRLLPADVNGTGGFEIASRYLAASQPNLGGDWYDAFRLGGGRVVVTVGDVVGHGVAAAAVMTQLRTTLRAYAADGHEPSGVVERVNRLMGEFGPMTMTTLAYVVIDAEEGSLEIVNAGHPPPLVIDPSGDASYLELPGGIPLGVSGAARYESHRHPFSAGSAIVLYTDGLVESRHAPIDVGLARLRELATNAGSMEGLCTMLVERLVPGERTDDIAIVAARFPAVDGRLSGQWPAERRVLADVRRLLRRWLRARGASDEETYDIVVACQEACANAIEHAYRPGRETFELDAGYQDGCVRVTVRDRGQWRAPRGTNRGHGVPLMRALMDFIDIQHTEDGTLVVLERRLGASVA